MKPRCVILGGGGHARVLIDTLQAAGEAIIHGILDADRDLWGTTCMDIPLLGGDERLAELAGQGVSHFAVGVGGVSGNGPRQRVFELGLSYGLAPLTAVHPTAIVSARARIVAGCQLFPGSIVNAGAELGLNVIVNTGAIVEHDCRIGNHVHVATGATLCGAVRVGDRSHVGAGATIRQSISIAEDALIGAGAVIVGHVDRQQVVIGNPARPMVRAATQA